MLNVIRKKQKKAQSLMLSYVILVSIVLAISIGVFAWLRYSANITPPVSCKEGTSMIMTNFECSGSGINLDLKNNGRFNIEGIILTVSNASSLINPIYLLPADIHNQAKDPGSFIFDDSIKPGASLTADYSNKSKRLIGTEGYGVETEVNLSGINYVQIQPFIIEENNIIICQGALIGQGVEECVV